jgi:predicted DNA-binding transcriptional regulator YafY
MPQSVPSHHYARRLQRLLALIHEIKTTPHQTPEALYTSLGISRAMFYKDCQELKDLGLAFHYDRQQRRYIITQDRYLPVLDLSTSEMLALIMAVRQTASTGDHTLTYEAIAALRKVVSNTPAEIRAFLEASLDDVVLQDGLGDRSLSALLQAACPVPGCLPGRDTPDLHVARQPHQKLRPSRRAYANPSRGLQLS